MPALWKTVRVFISSTFRDMQAERDHLVRFVFPRLREALLRHRIRLIDVDLRWGVTSDQDAVEVCREIIDQCRPHFLCILGGRYGWVPPGHERSITADEVHYGVLDCVTPPGHVHFYFRDPSATAAMEEDEPGQLREPSGSAAERKLAELKLAVVAAGYSPYVYPAAWDQARRQLTALEAFGRRVHDDVLASLDRELGTESAEASDESATEDGAQEAFVQARTERFVWGRRTAVRDVVLRHLRRTDSPAYFVLVGPPGSGKSALLAQLDREMATEDGVPPLVLSHFVGAGPGSSDVRFTLRRLSRRLIAGAGLNRELPEDALLPQVMEEMLRETCTRCRVVVLTDAVNQLDPSAEFPSLSWLPEHPPDGARFVLSSLPDQALDALRRRVEMQEVLLPPLAPDDAEAIIDDYLHLYRKRLTTGQRGVLLAKDDAGTPLYLLAALEELRTLGTYEEITDRIDRVPGRAVELFDWILQRLAADPGLGNPGLVGRFSSTLAASRRGLSQSELVELLDPGDPRGSVAALVRLLRPYLMWRGDLLDFYHDQFRSAAVSRYLGDEAARTGAHAALAEYFRRQADPTSDGQWGCESDRPLIEYPFHLAHSDSDGAAALLLDFTWLRAKVSRSLTSELLADFQETLAALLADHPQRATLGDLRGALELATHVLTNRPDQLPAQLVGRLAATDEPDLCRLLDEVRAWNGSRWLMPLVPNLTPPRRGLLRTIAGHRSEVWGIEIDSAGRRAVVRSEDRSVRLWDLDTGELLRLWERGEEGGTKVLFADDAVLVSVVGAGPVRTWDARTGAPVRELEPIGDGVCLLRTSPKGDSVLAGTVSGAVVVWDVHTARRLHLLAGHADTVTALAFSADGRTAVSGSADATLRVWDLVGGKPLGVLTCHAGPVTAVALTTDGRLAVSSSEDRTLNLWDLPAGRLVRSVQEGWIPMVAITVASGRYAVCQEGYLPNHRPGETFPIWDLETGELRYPARHDDEVLGVAVAGGGRRVLSWGRDEQLHVWDVETGARLHSFGLGREGCPVWAAVVSADGARAAASFSGRLSYYDVMTGRELGTVRNSTDRTAAIALSSDGRRMVAGSDSGVLRVWDLEGFPSDPPPNGHGNGVASVGVLAGGGQGFSRGTTGNWGQPGGRVSEVKTWTLATGQLLATVEGRVDPPMAGAVHGGRQVTISGATLEVLDPVQGGPPASFVGEFPFSCCAISPDGRWVIAGNPAGEVHFFRVVLPEASPPAPLRPPSASLGWLRRTWNSLVRWFAGPREVQVAGREERQPP